MPPPDQTDDVWVSPVEVFSAWLPVDAIGLMDDTMRRDYHDCYHMLFAVGVVGSPADPLYRYLTRLHPGLGSEELRQTLRDLRHLLHRYIAARTLRQHLLNRSFRRR